VCGLDAVRIDEVIDDGVLWLAECPRCAHRFTERPRASLAPAPRPEVRTAA
jgi:hypothetical protein